VDGDDLAHLDNCLSCHPVPSNTARQAARTEGQRPGAPRSRGLCKKPAWYITSTWS
jgi:hypothetical protein